MFNNQRYITSGINSQVSPILQVSLWAMIDALAVSEFEMDYLQIFKLSRESMNGKEIQKVIHLQEQPAFQKVYYLEFEEPIEAKIYVIDSKNYSTMLLAEEY